MGNENERKLNKAPQGRYTPVIVSHSLCKLIYHCVFSTKDRHQFLKPDIRERVYGYIRGIVRELDGQLIAIGGTNDHVHLLVELPGTLAIADAMRLVKTNSSKWVHETLPTQSEFAWQTGYAAFTVSESAKQPVIEYIQKQTEHHRDRTFDDEIRLMASRHGMVLDERFLAS